MQPCCITKHAGCCFVLFGSSCCRSRAYGAEGRGQGIDLSGLHQCVPASAEACRTLALARDVVAQSAVATLAVLAAVDAILAERARLGTDRPLQSKQLAVTLGGSENSWNTHLLMFMKLDKHSMVQY